MSESPAAPTEMTRKELEEEVVEMRAEITELNDSSQQMQKDIAFLKKTLITLTDADLGDDMGVMDLPKHGKHLRSDIEDLQRVVNHHSEQLAAVSDVSQKKTEKEGQVASIAAFAMQQANDSEATVLVDVNEIRGCTGVTRRYAYELIDDIGEDAEYGWASIRTPETVQTSSGPKQKTKGLLVDCDICVRVHSNRTV